MYYNKESRLERGYAIFQEYLPNNHFDTRIVVIGKRAFGMRRFNRPNDFRASGSGVFDYDHNQICEKAIESAFAMSEQLRSDCLAFDYLLNERGEPVLVEMCFGINPQAYRDCEGFWDETLTWHQSPWPEGEFQFEDFIVEDFIKRIKEKKIAVSSNI